MSTSKPTSPSSVSPLSEEACTAGWCCGKTCIRHEDEPASTPHVRNPDAGVCAGCARRLLSQLSTALREIERLRSVIGANYSVQRWTGANIAEVEKERDAYRAALEEIAAIENIGDGETLRRVRSLARAALSAEVK